MDSLSAPLYVPYDLTPFFLGQWEHMTVQHWGVLAGVVTYCLTVTVVVVLLILGGTCTRLREQAEAFESVGKAAFAAPFERFQLYDELLDAARTLPLKPTLPDRKAESDLDESKEGGGSGRSARSAIVGKTVELLAYDPKEHLERLFTISDGSPQYAHGPYNSEEALWRFLDAPLPRQAKVASEAKIFEAAGAAQGGGGRGGGNEGGEVSGPLVVFEDSAALGGAACVRDPGANGLRLVIVDRATSYVVGMVAVLDNAPTELRCRLGDIWLTPAFQRTHAATDAVLSLLSHLFGPRCRYRRLEWHCDSRDKRGRKAAERYGFLLEGILRKHRVDSRGCNVDTALYALTNSDWRDDGVKNALEKKLRPPSEHGISASTRPVATISAEHH